MRVTGVKYASSFFFTFPSFMSFGQKISARVTSVAYASLFIFQTDNRYFLSARVVVVAVVVVAVVVVVVIITAGERDRKIHENQSLRPSDE